MKSNRKKCTFTIGDSSYHQHKNLPVRYVCKDCLETFKDEIYIPTQVCWECGGELIGIERKIGVVSGDK